MRNHLCLWRRTFRSNCIPAAKRQPQCGSQSADQSSCIPSCVLLVAYQYTHPCRTCHRIDRSVSLSIYFSLASWVTWGSVIHTFECLYAIAAAALCPWKSCHFCWKHRPKRCVQSAEQQHVKGKHAYHRKAAKGVLMNCRLANDYFESIHIYEATQAWLDKWGWESQLMVS